MLSCSSLGNNGIILHKEILVNSRPTVTHENDSNDPKSRDPDLTAWAYLIL